MYVSASFFALYRKITPLVGVKWPNSE